MSLPNPDTVVTEQRLSEFYQNILPYLGGSADAGFTPVGSIIAIMGVTAPANYLACDGTVYNIADYPELANYFYQQFGSKNKFGGNGTTTFAVPDLSGEFLRGTGTNSHANQGSGANVGVHQDGTEFPNIGVNTTTQKALFTLSNTGSIMTSKADGTIVEATTKGLQTVKDSMSTTWEGAGGISRYTARPTNTSVLFCIATKNIYLDPKNDYSTDEKVVGTWIDGKTIYQRTIVDTMPDATTDGVGTTKRISISFSIDKVVNVVAIKSWGTAGTDLCFNDFNDTYKQNDSQIWTRYWIGADAKVIGMTNSRTSFNGKPVYFTIQYTKTT